MTVELELDEFQKKAVDNSLDLTKRLVAVSGEAGTGKTSLLKTIADRLKENKVRFALAAPTGKAAKRIAEATGHYAMTIHRLLEYTNPGEINEETGEPVLDSEPRRTRANPLDYDVVLVDEYAMVNVELHRNLVDALPPGGVIRVFGDISQLAPIEKYTLQKPYWPFQECMAKPHAVTLQVVYRQEEGNGVLEAARLIRQGRMPKRSNDFTLTLTDRHVDQLISYISEMQDQDISFGTTANQIISPASTKSWLSSQRLNGVIQQLFIDTDTESLMLPRNHWDKTEVKVHVGDKVVCTKNMYDMRDYFDRYESWIDQFRPERSTFIAVPDNKYMLNGEVGIVLDIYEDGTIEIDLGDRIVQVPYSFKEYWDNKAKLFDYDPRKNIDLAYVLTTHKTQGSEYQHVVYILDQRLFYLTNRRNFYTAVTRARKTVRVICDQKGLQNSLREAR